MALEVTEIIGKSSGPDNFTEMPTVGGDPIVESGSNSDGEWTRWADGTQQCTGEVLVPGGEGSPSTAMRNYPIPFSQSPRASATSKGITGTLVRPATVNAVSADLIEVVVIRSNTTSTQNDYIAVGRWK